MAAGLLRGHSRKLVVVACYIPPNCTRVRGSGALEFITDTVISMKRRFNDTYIVVVGHYNQCNVDVALSDFADISEVQVGNTRHDRSIHRIFLNMGRTVTESGTLDGDLDLDLRLNLF